MVTSTSSGSVVPEGDRYRSSQGWFALSPAVVDAVVAVGVFVLELIGILSRVANESGELDLSVLAEEHAAVYLLLVASSVALLWRRSRPVIVMLVTLTIALVWDVVGLDGGPSLAVFVSLYGVGRYIADRGASLVAVGASVLLVVVNDLIEGEPASVVGLSLAVVFLGWYLGRRIRGHKEHLALLEERAEYLERERAFEAQRAVDEERTRIARELHDLVAHKVSMITVQAGAAQTVATSDPDKAVRAMKSVEEAGREALDELRQILGVLRDDNESDVLDPVHGLAEIPGLVDEMGRMGTGVSLSMDGIPKAVPAGVDLASYRIVQEALTNVLKHAGPDAKTNVRLSAEDGMLVIEVTDRGSGTSVLPGSGHGLVGMRERAMLLGGTFEAGPRLGGGFRIMARLPVERGSA